MSMGAIAEDAILVEEASTARGREILDRAARRLMGMSGDDFFTAWHNGKFEGTADEPIAARVALFLPFVEE